MQPGTKHDPGRKDGRTPFWNLVSWWEMRIGDHEGDLRAAGEERERRQPVTVAASFPGASAGDPGPQ